MKRHGVFFAALCIATGLSCAAQAKTWTVDYANSHIGFAGMQGDDSFSGGFRKFQIDINFDPDKPENGKITATIDMVSAFADAPIRTNALPKDDWFDTGQFPQAQFVSTGIQWDRNPAQPTLKQNTGCYKAMGNLSIKGITQPVTMPFCIVPEGNHTRAKGMVMLMRLDFGVGKGKWAEPSFIKNEVDVTLDIAAQ